MPWTRDTLVARVRHVANLEDATGDWPADVVLDFCRLVHGIEWGHLLGMNPRLRLARRVVTIGADGVVPLSALSVTGEVWDRIVAIVPGTLSLKETLAWWSTQLGRDAGIPWQRVGDDIVVDRDAGPATLLVTHTPPFPATDEEFVQWPDGHEMLLAYAIGAHLLHKGARESDAAAVLEQQAERLREQMLARFGRDRTGPLMVAAVDDPQDWGGF
jgi:hypothetical protein